MLVQRSGKKVLVTPITAEDLMNIHIGDILYLDGDLVTCRDIAHRRLVEEGCSLPIDVCDRAIFHAGPIVRQAEGNRYEIVFRWPNAPVCGWSNLNTNSLKNRCSAYRWKRRNGITDTKSMPTIWSNPLCFSCWLCSNSRDGGGVRRWAFLGRTGHARNTLVVQGKRIRPANRFNRYIRKKPV